MKIGDIVEVVDEGSFWYHAHGRIVDLNREGDLVLEIEGLRVLMTAHQVDFAEDLPEAA